MSPVFGFGRGFSEPGAADRPDVGCSLCATSDRSNDAGYEPPSLIQQRDFPVRRWRNHCSSDADEDPRCAGKATPSIYRRAGRGFLADRHVAGGNIFSTASMMHPLCDSYAKPIRLGALPSAARIIVPRTRFHDVADPAHGVQRVRAGMAVELAAKPADIDVDRADFGVGLVAKDVCKQVRTRKTRPGCLMKRVRCGIESAPAKHRGRRASRGAFRGRVPRP